MLPIITRDTRAPTKAERLAAYRFASAFGEQRLAYPWPWIGSGKRQKTKRAKR